MTLPALPKEVYSMLGPVKVIEKRMKKYLGRCSLKDRVIKVNPEQNQTQAWQTLFHEMVHLALMDSGVGNQIEHDLQESVCDALGTYFAGAVRSGAISFSSGPVIP